MKKLTLNVVVVALALFAAACGSDSLNSAACEDNGDCPPGYACIDERCEMQCGLDGDACDDGNPCTTADTCKVGVCTGGPALADGAVCDLDSDADTRDLCLGAVCVKSKCGDSYIDPGMTPPEDCDDGNAQSSDGCEWDCTILPPGLTLTSPERGQTLTGNETVQVRGAAADEWHGPVTVKVNGQAVTVGSDGTWAFNMAAEHGFNFVEVIATNAAGKSSRRTVGFYYSDDYNEIGAPVTDTAPIADGIFMRLSQEAIDDKNHPCAYDTSGVYKCTEVDDIATLGEMTLNNLDVQATLGSVPVYERVEEVMNDTNTYECTGCAGISSLHIRGDLLALGTTRLVTEIVTLDFNAMKLGMMAQEGGLQADVAVDEVANADNTAMIPGFRLQLRTTARLDVAVKFDQATLTADISGYNSLPLICLFLFDGVGHDADDPYSYVCPHKDAGETVSDVDPMATLNPLAYADSGMSIGSMLMQNILDVTTGPTGGVQVTLEGGAVNFNGSTIDIQPIENMVVDLGDAVLFGEPYDMGEYPLTDLTGPINELSSDLLSFFLNDMQSLMEPILSAALLNPDDPMSVGKLVERLIGGLEVDKAMPLPLFASQSSAPAVTMKTGITSIAVTPPVGTNYLTGGMTPAFSTLFTAPKVVQRNPLGSIMSTSCYFDPTPPAFPQTSVLEMSEHVDAMNQALFAVWYNGGFNVAFNNTHLSTALPADLQVTAFNVTPLFYTAPILDNCDGARLTLSAADVSVAGSFTVAGAAHNFQGFLNVGVPVNIATSSGKPVLQRSTSGTPLVALELTANSGLSAALLSKLQTLLGRVVVDEVMVRYGSQVLAAMPALELDYSALGNGTEATRLNFEALAAQTMNAYTLLRGDIVE